MLASCAAAALVGGALAGSGADGDGDHPDHSGPPAPGGLTLRQQIGQLLVSSFDGTRAPAYLLRRLSARETAGVILFGRNVASERQLRSLTRQVQQAAGGGALVAVDQEGGSIRTVRFAGPAVAPAAQGGPAEVARHARRSARELRAVGVNVNLAPVADVAEGPGSVLAGRAFAGGPADVAVRVRAAVRGARRGDVAATAKHFPGLGAASRNTDDAAVTIASPPASLARQLEPFRAAVSGRVPLVMASHALYPALDPARIASQSAAVLERLLRGRLRFRGVVVTDSMEAEAVVQRSPVAKAAERSVAAGADLVLMTGSATWKLVFPRLLARARRSPAFRSRVREAAGRVLRLKRELGPRRPR